MKLTVANAVDIMVERNACNKAVSWMRQHAHEGLLWMYSNCPRGDWLAFILHEVEDEGLLTRLANECIAIVAESPLYYFTEADQKVLKMILKNPEDPELTFHRGESPMIRSLTTFMRTGFGFQALWMLCNYVHFCEEAEGKEPTVMEELADKVRSVLSFKTLYERLQGDEDGIAGHEGICGSVREDD